MAPYRASCTNDMCDWGDKIRFREDNATQEASAHHDETNHTTTVSEIDDDDILHQFGE